MKALKCVSDAALYTQAVASALGGELHYITPQEFAHGLGFTVATLVLGFTVTTQVSNPQPYLTAMCGAVLFHHTRPRPSAAGDVFFAYANRGNHNTPTCPLCLVAHWNKDK